MKINQEKLVQGVFVPYLGDIGPADGTQRLIPTNARQIADNVYDVDRDFKPDLFITRSVPRQTLIDGTWLQPVQGNVFDIYVYDDQAGARAMALVCVDPGREPYLAAVVSNNGRVTQQTVMLADFGAPNGRADAWMSTGPQGTRTAYDANGDGYID